jgi:hypothetical protein
MFANHKDRIESAGVLRPLAERWLQEINARKEVERANSTYPDNAPSQSTPTVAFPGRLLLERIPSGVKFIPFMTNHDPSEYVAKKILQPIGTNEYESRTGSVYGFSRKISPGFVKIGFTSHSVRSRLSEWAGCGYLPELLFQVDEIPSARRAEWLTHYELRNEWRQERWCENCLCPHQEWFEVSAEKAEKVVRNWASFLIKAQPYEANGSIKRWWEAAINRMELKGVEVTAQELMKVYDAKMAADLEEETRQPDEKHHSYVADTEDQVTEVEEKDDEKVGADAASTSVADSTTSKMKTLLKRSEEERLERLDLKPTQFGVAGNTTSVSSIPSESSHADDEATSLSSTSVAPPPPARVFKFEPIETSVFQPKSFRVSESPSSQLRQQFLLSDTSVASKPFTAEMHPPTTNEFKFELPAQSNRTESVSAQLPTSSSFNFAEIFKALPRVEEKLSPEQISLPPSPVLLQEAISKDEEVKIDRLVESDCVHALSDSSQEEPRVLGWDLDPGQNSSNGSEAGNDDEEEEEEEEADEEMTLVQGISSCPESIETKTKPAVENWDGDTTVLDSQVVDPLVMKMATLAVVSKLSMGVSITAKSLIDDSSPTAGTGSGDGLLAPV